MKVFGMKARFIFLSMMSTAYGFAFITLDGFSFINVSSGFTYFPVKISLAFLRPSLSLFRADDFLDFFPLEGLVFFYLACSVMKNLLRDSPNMDSDYDILNSNNSDT